MEFQFRSKRESSCIQVLCSTHLFLSRYKYLYPWHTNEFPINVSLVLLMHVKRRKQINKYGQLNQKREIKFQT
ncbi:hypothetical protein BDE02_12G013800 [Populus trichocarpa]|nr:hypothetical protein BDE02_12G013800 [Populus trichocarpa]